MAKLTNMPEDYIISGMYGVVDYYYWKGIPVARRWPRTPKTPRIPLVKVRANRFAYVNRKAKLLPPNIFEAYKAMAVAGPMTWRDYMTRCFINGQASITFTHLE